MIHNHTALLGKTNAFTLLHFVAIVIYLSFHILLSPVIAALPNVNRVKSSPLQVPESSKWHRGRQNPEIFLFSPHLIQILLSLQ